jgi:hypothetical protein
MPTQNILLELQPDRIPVVFGQLAGRKPNAEGYGRWDGPGAT